MRLKMIVEDGVGSIDKWLPLTTAMSAQTLSSNLAANVILETFAPCAKQKHN